MKGARIRALTQECFFKFFINRNIVEMKGARIRALNSIINLSLQRRRLFLMEKSRKLYANKSAKNVGTALLI